MKNGGFSFIMKSDETWRFYHEKSRLSMNTRGVTKKNGGFSVINGCFGIENITMKDWDLSIENGCVSSTHRDMRLCELVCLRVRKRPQ